jgi:hypothetical protein
MQFTSLVTILVVFYVLRTGTWRPYHSLIKSRRSGLSSASTIECYHEVNSSGISSAPEQNLSVFIHYMGNAHITINVEKRKSSVLLCTETAVYTLHSFYKEPCKALLEVN